MPPCRCSTPQAHTNSSRSYVCKGVQATGCALSGCEELTFTVSNSFIAPFPAMADSQRDRTELRRVLSKKVPAAAKSASQRSRSMLCFVRATSTRSCWKAYNGKISLPRFSRRPCAIYFFGAVLSRLVSQSLIGRSSSTTAVGQCAFRLLNPAQNQHQCLIVDC